MANVKKEKPNKKVTSRKTKGSSENSASKKKASLLTLFIQLIGLKIKLLFVSAFSSKGKKVKVTSDAKQKYKEVKAKASKEEKEEKKNKKGWLLLFLIPVGCCALLFKCQPIQSSSLPSSISNIERTILSIEVVEKPQTEYNLNETLNIDGGYILIKYSNNETEKIALSQTTIKPVDTSTSGKKDVQVSYQGKSCSYGINVNGITNISLNPETINLYVGDVYTLAPIYTPSEASLDEMIFITSNKAIATVSDKGVILGVAIGKTEVNVTSKYNTNVTAKITVNVIRRSSGGGGSSAPTHLYKVDLATGEWKSTIDNHVLTLTQGDYIVVASGVVTSLTLSESEFKPYSSWNTLSSLGITYNETGKYLSYVNTSATAKNLFIKTGDATNGTDKIVIDIDGALDSAYHYGTAYAVTINRIAGTSYHEYATVHDLQLLTSGRIVLEEKSKVTDLEISKNIASTDYSVVIENNASVSADDASVGVIAYPTGTGTSISIKKSGCSLGDGTGTTIRSAAINATDLYRQGKDVVASGSTITLPTSGSTITTGEEYKDTLRFIGDAKSADWGKGTLTSATDLDLSNYKIKINKNAYASIDTGGTLGSPSTLKVGKIVNYGVFKLPKYNNLVLSDASTSLYNLSEVIKGTGTSITDSNPTTPTNVTVVGNAETDVQLQDGASKEYGFNEMLVLAEGLTGDTTYTLLGNIDFATTPYVAPSYIGTRYDSTNKKIKINLTQKVTINLSNNTFNLGNNSFISSAATNNLFYSGSDGKVESTYTNYDALVKTEMLADEYVYYMDIDNEYKIKQFTTPWSGTNNIYGAVRVTGAIKNYLASGLNISRVDGSKYTIATTQKYKIDVYNAVPNGTPVSMDDVPEWATETIYNLNDYVKLNTTLYKCKTAHKSVLILDWTPSSFYRVNDYVKSGTKIYKCNTRHTSDDTSFAADAGKWAEKTVSEIITESGYWDVITTLSSVLNTYYYDDINKAIADINTNSNRSTTHDEVLTLNSTIASHDLVVNTGTSNKQFSIDTKSQSLMKLTIQGNGKIILMDTKDDGSVVEELYLETKEGAEVTVDAKYGIFEAVNYKDVNDTNNTAKGKLIIEDGYFTCVHAVTDTVYYPVVQADPSYTSFKNAYVLTKEKENSVTDLSVEINGGQFYSKDFFDWYEEDPVDSNNDRSKKAKLLDPNYFVDHLGLDKVFCFDDQTYVLSAALVIDLPATMTDLYYSINLPSHDNPGDDTPCFAFAYNIDGGDGTSSGALDNIIEYLSLPVDRDTFGINVYGTGGNYISERNYFYTSNRWISDCLYSHVSEPFQMSLVWEQNGTNVSLKTYYYCVDDDGSGSPLSGVNLKSNQEIICGSFTNTSVGDVNSDGNIDKTDANSRMVSNSLFAVECEDICDDDLLVVNNLCLLVEVNSQKYFANSDNKVNGILSANSSYPAKVGLISDDDHNMSKIADTSPHTLEIKFTKSESSDQSSFTYYEAGFASTEYASDYGDLSGLTYEDITNFCTSGSGPTGSSAYLYGVRIVGIDDAADKTIDVFSYLDGLCINYLDRGYSGDALNNIVPLAINWNSCNIDLDLCSQAYLLLTSIASPTNSGMDNNFTIKYKTGGSTENPYLWNPAPSGGGTKYMQSKFNNCLETGKNLSNYSGNNAFARIS